MRTRAGASPRIGSRELPATVARLRAALGEKDDDARGHIHGGLERGKVAEVIHIQPDARPGPEEVSEPLLESARLVLTSGPDVGDEGVGALHDAWLISSTAPPDGALAGGERIPASGCTLSSGQ